MASKRSTELPFKLSAQTKGAQKAYKRFVNEYGVIDGTRIYLQKAEEQGTGTTVRQKVNSVYKRGAKLKNAPN